MRCPYCRCTDPKKGTIVIDSREHGDGESIRRRRKCPNCGMRFTTYERFEPTELRVVKKDGRREDFDRAKLRAKLLLALTKRPVSEEQIDALIGAVERELVQRGEREVTSPQIGELVMRHLKDLDEIAYIRFASVYRNFHDLSSLRNEMEALSRRNETEALSRRNETEALSRRNEDEVLTRRNTDEALTRPGAGPDVE